MTSFKRSFRVATSASLAIWSAAACGDDDSKGPIDPGPTAGTLTITLTTPNADDGAILFEVNGPDMTQVTASNPSLYFRYSQAVGRITAVLVGDVAAGDVLSFHVPDVDAFASYVPTVLDVAGRGNELRSSLAGYELTVD